MKFKALLSDSSGDRWEEFDAPTDDPAAWLSARISAFNGKQPADKKVDLKQVILLEDEMTKTTKSAPPVAAPASPPMLGVGEFDLDRVHPSKTNYRRIQNAIDDAKLLESVKERGVLQPIIVKKLSGTETYEIVAGHRRYEAAKKAGLKTIRAMVFSGSEEEANEIRMIENLQRTDVHPLDEADGFAELLKRAGSLDVVCSKVRKEKHYVVKRLQLMKLDAKARKVYADGKITLDHAFELAKLQPNDQKGCLDRMFEDNGSGRLVVGIEHFRQFVKQNVFRDLSRVPWDLKDEKLVEKAGSCAACPKRAGNQPDLFGDVKPKKGDLCTDGACFKTKQTAFLEATIDAASKAGKPLRKITDQYAPFGEKSKEFGVIGTKDYLALRNDAAGCPSETRGILVEAYNRSVGEIIRICPDSKCKVHRPGRVKSDAEKNARINAKRQDELQRATRRTVLMATLQAVHSTPTRKDLELSAMALLENLHQDHRVAACSLFGWVDELRKEFDEEQAKQGEPKKGEYRPRFAPDLTEAAKVRLKTMNDEQLNKFIAACSLAPHLNPMYVGDDDVLFAAAGDRGIDVKGIISQVQKDLGAKWKEKDKAKGKKEVKSDSQKQLPLDKSSKTSTKKPAKKKAPRAKMAPDSEKEEE